MLQIILIHFPKEKTFKRIACFISSSKRTMFLTKKACSNILPSLIIIPRTKTIRIHCQLQVLILEQKCPKKTVRIHRQLQNLIFEQSVQRKLFEFSTSTHPVPFLILEKNVSQEENQSKNFPTKKKIKNWVCALTTPTIIRNTKQNFPLFLSQKSTSIITKACLPDSLLQSSAIRSCY